MVFDATEMDGAFEKLLLRKNGGEKTVNDICEFLVAMHHDSKARDAKLQLLFDAHLDDFASHLAEMKHVDPQTFESIITGFTERAAKRDAAVVKMERDIDSIKQTIHRFGVEVDTIKEHCQELMPEEGWQEDEEVGDIRRAWRVGKWFVMAAAIPLLVTLGNAISKYLLLP